MDITIKDSLEDTGVKFENANGGLILSKYAIKVVDVTSPLAEDIKNEITKVMETLRNQTNI